MSLSTFTKILREAYNFLVFEFSNIQLASLLLGMDYLLLYSPKAPVTPPLTQNVCKRHLLRFSE